MEPLQAGDLEGLELLGFGGFGTVYKGRSKKLCKDIALKILHGKSSDDIKTLKEEKEMILKANDTYVIRVLTTYEEHVGNHVKYGLVMEYMCHGTLHFLFDTFNKKNDLIPWALRFQILHQVTLAMNFLHSLTPPIIHRDLKPQNVLLDDFLNIRVTDFGLARHATSLSSGKAGTISYMPPEALESDECTPTKAFDVYSFAILTWSVLSGLDPYPAKIEKIITHNVLQKKRPPLECLDPWKNENMVPKGIEMMEKCWAHEPCERPSFVECADWLEQMKKPYAKNINKDVFDVVNKLLFLKVYSSQVVKVADTPDGVNNSSSTDAANTSKMESFINRLCRDNEIEAIVLEDAERFLIKNFATIVQETPEWSYILDELLRQEIFTGEDVDHVKSFPNGRSQIRETLNMIMKQGRISCRTLLQLMNRHHPSLIRALAVPANVGPSSVLHRP